MDKMLFNVILVAAISVAITIGSIVILKTKIENNITQRVIDRIKTEYMRDYVPGPYTPGFNPDKVSQVPKEESWTVAWENARN